MSNTISRFYNVSGLRIQVRKARHLVLTGYVYLAAFSDTGLFKIGHSKSPNKRIQRLNTASPVPIELAHYFPCDDPMAAERYLHDYFSDFRVKGEWFKLTREEYSKIFRIKCFICGRFDYWAPPSNLPY